MTICLDGIPIGDISTALNDPSPFTLLALELAVAKRRGIPWQRISGTSNQSDYLSHFVANHMFFRLALPGARRVLLDHIAFCRQHVPQWNPLSIVGQHMQQAGATPAEAMGLTLSSAIQYASDCLARGWDPDQFLPRFTFFFDISISFFEEVAKFRAGRRIWARLARERFGAKDARSWRFKFHGQTSGVDLTREQPLNNIARVTAQAMAGIFGGLQSLHTDAYDEVLSVPTEKAARIAVSTQNILKEEAYLTDVIDPLGGSYYVEKLTDQMEEKILEVIARIDAAGGMYAAVEQGLAQRICGESALAFQERVDAGAQTVVGVNKYRVPAEEEMQREALKPPPRKTIDAQLKRLKRFKAERSQAGVRRAIDALTRAAESKDENVLREGGGGRLSRRDARRDLRDAAQGVRLRAAADRGLAFELCIRRRNVVALGACPGIQPINLLRNSRLAGSRDKPADDAKFPASGELSPVEAEGDAEAVGDVGAVLLGQLPGVLGDGDLGDRQHRARRLEQELRQLGDGAVLGHRHGLARCRSPWPRRRCRCGWR